MTSCNKVWSHIASVFGEDCDALYVRERLLSRVSQDLEAMGRPHFGRVRGQLPGSTKKARTATHLSWQHVGAGGVEAAAWCMAAKATWCQQPQMEAVCSNFAATIRETSRCKRHPGAAPTNSTGPPLRPPSNRPGFKSAGAKQSKKKTWAH